MWYDRVKQVLIIKCFGFTKPEGTTAERKLPGLSLLHPTIEWINFCGHFENGQSSLFIFPDSHVPHAEIGNLYDFLYQLKHLKVSTNLLIVNSLFLQFSY